MSVTKALLERHAKNLSQEQIAHLENLNRKNLDAVKYAWPTKLAGDHNYFIRLDRIFTKDAVELFGQVAPSMAYNKISVQRLNHNSEPGEVVLSALMSEQAVTTMMLSSNMGSAGIPATCHTLSGQELPEFKMEEHMHDVAHEQSKSSVLMKLTNTATEAIEAAETATSIPKRRKAIEALKELHKFVSKADNMGFYMDMRAASYSKKRVDFASEAANAALHADRIMDPNLLLEDHTAAAEIDRDENVMLNAILGHWSAEETNAMAELMRLEMERIHSEFGFDLTQHINKNGQMDSFRDMRFPSDEAKAAVHAIRGLVNNAMNKYVLQGRSQQTAHGLGLNVTRTQMSGEYMHSSLPVSGGDLFRLSFHSAYEEIELGRSKMSGSHSEILEVQLGADDFMMMLRGHPTGAATPCTLRSLAGVSRDLPERKPHELEVGLSEIRSAVIKSDAGRDVRSLVSEIEGLITKSVKPKEFKEKTRDLRQACVAYFSALQDGFEDSEELLRSSMADVVRADIGKMRSQLQVVFLEKIMLTSGRVGPDHLDHSP